MAGVTFPLTDQDRGQNYLLLAGADRGFGLTIDPSQLMFDIHFSSPMK